MFRVVLTINNHFTDLALACVNSIIDTRLYAKDKIVIDILCFKDDISQKNIEWIEALSTKNTTVKVIQVEPEIKNFCDNLCQRVKENITPTPPIIWLRLLIPKLYTKRDTVVYVDADICVRTDIKQLIDAYNNPEQPLVGFRHRRQGLADIMENTITAAFFVFNLKALDKDKWFDAIDRCIANGSNDDYLLQVLFNEFEHSHSLPQDLICNRVSAQQVPNSMLDNDDHLMYINKRFDEQYRTAEIVHYAGEPKPKFDRMNFTDSLFAYNYLGAKRRIKLKLEKPEPKECIPCNLKKLNL